MRFFCVVDGNPLSFKAKQRPFRKFPLDFYSLFDIPNPAAEFETKVLQKIGIEQFERRLTEQDKQILRMRMDGSSLKEIAAAVGFKTPSAVSKHIEKIAGAYEDYVSGKYGSFLDKHTK